MRLDKFILQKYPNLSRAYIKKQIKSGWFLINNKKAKPSYEMREGDLVAFAPGFEFKTENKIQPNPDIKLDIIYEDSNVIVIDKPAGISVHPRQTKTGAPVAKELNNTLVSGLLAYYPPITTVGDDPTVRPGLVHRLDKDTSGVMIIAKNQKSFEWLKKQFKERKVQKKYIALVCGQLKDDKGEIKTYLTRSASDPSKQKVVPLETAEGRALSEDRRPKGRAGVGGREREAWPSADTNRKLREAITNYKVIKKFKNFCLIEAHPQTGRLHQIRAQFAWLGNPIAGDTKYGKKNQPIPVGLSRQFLHAAELKIALPASPTGGPNGQKKTFFSLLPTELAQIAEKLKKN